MPHRKSIRFLRDLPLFRNNRKPGRLRKIVWLPFRMGRPVTDLRRFALDPSVDADEGGMRTNAPAITAAAFIDERSVAATAIIGIKTRAKQRADSCPDFGPRRREVTVVVT